MKRLRAWALAALAGSLLVAVAGCSVRESVLYYSCQWPMWGQNPSRTFSNDDGSCPTDISPESVGNLQEKWHFETSDVVTATPAVVDGTVYVGDWIGDFYALSLADGTPRWTYEAKLHPDVSFGQIVSSAALAKVGGISTVLFSSGKTFYALSASDGALRWQHELGSKDLEDPTEIESSPVVAEGLVIFGADVFGSPYGYRAGLYALDAETGEERWHFDPEEGLSPKGCGDVWSSPAVDLKSRTVYIGTGNCFEEENYTRYSEAIVALDLDTGEPRWSYQPHQFNKDDLDFAGAPNLIQAEGQDLIGLGNKDGAYYALTPEGELAWKQQAANPDPGPGNTGGFLGPTGFADGTLFGGTGRKNGPFLHALDAKTGHILWHRSDTAPIFGAPAEAGGVLFVGDREGTLRAVELATGEQLWQTKADGRILGGAAIVGAKVVTVEGFRNPKTGERSEARGVTVYALP